MRSLALIVAIVVSATGCSFLAGGESEQFLTASDVGFDPSGPCAGVLLPTVTLVVDPGPTPHLVIETGDGVRSQPVWPDGWSGRITGPSSVEVVNPHGDVVFHEGMSFTNVQACVLPGSRYYLRFGR